MSNKSHISGLKIFLLIPQSTVIHEYIHSVHTAHDPGPYDGCVAAILSFNLADHLEKRTHRSLEGFCERCVYTHRRRCLGVTEGRLAVYTVVLKQSTELEIQVHIFDFNENQIHLLLCSQSRVF